MNGDIARRVGYFASKHAPKILTCAAIAGVALTAITSHRAGVKATKIVLINEPDATLKERLKLTWQEYVAPVAFGLVTAITILQLNRVHSARTKAVVALYGLAQTALSEYKDKVKDVLGERKARQMDDDIAKERMEKTPRTNVTQLMECKTGHLCYDKYTARYFVSSMEELRKIQNDVNDLILRDLYISLNEVYYMLGLDECELGNELGWGWDTTGQLEFKFSTHMTPEGVPCIVLDYTVKPLFDFNHFG